MLNQVKPAKSTCRDDSIGEIVNELNGILWTDADTFQLETLGGVPVYGATAIGAFYHHIPDNGIGMIIYAPHVGFDAEKGFGYLKRRGRKEIGKSCGANHKLIGLWKEGSFSPYENDPELTSVSEALNGRYQQILDDPSPITRIADEEYVVGLQMLTGFITYTQHSEHHQYPILLVSGVHIDTQPSEPNRFQLRSIRLFENGSYKEISRKEVHKQQ